MAERSVQYSGFVPPNRLSARTVSGLRVASADQLTLRRKALA
jgi:hypothetical protein